MKYNLNFLSLWFGLVMVILVLAGAIAFTFTDFLDDRLYGNKRILMAVIFFGYAVYRGIRIYQILKAQKNGSEN
jgi:hypothetical protein